MKKLTTLIVLALLMISQRADAAATASPNQNDMQVLSTDATFQNRVREAWLAYCVNTVLTESITSASLELHLKRVNFCASVMSTVGAPDNYKVNFAQTAASNATVVGDATAAGATPLTSGNVAAQAAIIPDGDVNNAVAASFNIFLSQP